MEEALGAHECVGSSVHLGISESTLGGHSAEQMFHKYCEEIAQETGFLEATDCLELTESLFQRASLMPNLRPTPISKHPKNKKKERKLKRQTTRRTSRSSQRSSRCDSEIYP